MKIAITGDFHFGFNDDAPNQARRVLLDACEKADAIILAGDLFDTRIPKQETIYESIKIFRECQFSNTPKVSIFSLEGNEKIPLSQTPLIAIYGTHERRTKGLVNVIQLLDSAGVLINCHARKIQLETLDEQTNEPDSVTIQGLGGMPEELASKVVGYMDYRPIEDSFNIFVFHQSIRELIPQDEDCLTMDQLPEDFDLYVDGHIHWRQEFKDSKKLLLLAGSTVVTQMKQNETNPKGYYLYDTIKKKSTFIVVPTRPFVFKEIVFENANPSKITEEVKLALSNISREFASQTPLVKLKITGTLANGFTSSQIDLRGISKDYAQTMRLSIDKDLGTVEFAERLEQLRQIKQEQQSSSELGLSIFTKILEENGLDKNNLPLSTADLFDLLCLSEIDRILESFGL